MALDAYAGLGWNSALRTKAIGELVEGDAPRSSLSHTRNPGERGSPACPGERLAPCCTETPLSAAAMRTEAHLFLCMLAGYPPRHLRQALESLLIDDQETRSPRSFRSSGTLAMLAVALETSVRMAPDSQ